VRVVFDSNVFLAAFLTEGLCAKLLTRARKRHFDLCICPCILEEIERILKKKFKAGPDEISATLTLINEASSQLVSPDSVVHDVCRDKDDNKILACARAAKADYLVSGDADLLVLESFEGTVIVRPRDFEAFMV
jgi:putative PIN family toxin of toxin-antitoxin system